MIEFFRIPMIYSQHRDTIRSAQHTEITKEGFRRKPRLTFVEHMPAVKRARNDDNLCTVPGLVNIQKAIEICHRNSGFYHSTLWFSMIMLVYNLCRTCVFSASIRDIVIARELVPHTGHTIPSFRDFFLSLLPAAKQKEQHMETCTWWNYRLFHIEKMCGPICFGNLYPIASMVLVYMLTWLGYNDGIHVTIYKAAPWILWDLLG